MVEDTVTGIYASINMKGGLFEEFPTDRESEILSDFSITVSSALLC